MSCTIQCLTEKHKLPVFPKITDSADSLYFLNKMRLTYLIKALIKHIDSLKKLM